MRQAGVTLIELMIVVLIIGLIAMAASPFTSVWVKDARTAEAAAAMEQAVGKAKSLAMRNATRVTGDAPAAMLCLSAAKTQVNLVVPTGPGVTLTCDLAPVWSTGIAEIVSVKTLGASDIATDWTCSCFTNKGLSTKTGPNCSTCSASLRFRFSHDAHSGDEGDTRNFF